MVYIERHIRVFLCVSFNERHERSAPADLVVDSGAAYLPVVYSRLFGHELVDARAALAHASNPINVQPEGDNRTYIPKHEAVQTNKFCKLSVPFVYLSRSAPQTSRDGHCGENAIVIEE